PSMQKLVEDMFETMHVSHGVGLAAPQIALSIRLFVAEFEDHKVAMFNPEIIKAEGEELGTEGCLSIPGYVGDNIRRATSILAKGAFTSLTHVESFFFAILEIGHSIVQVADAAACAIGLACDLAILRE